MEFPYVPYARLCWLDWLVCLSKFPKKRLLPFFCLFRPLISLSIAYSTSICHNVCLSQKSLKRHIFFSSPESGPRFFFASNFPLKQWTIGRTFWLNIASLWAKMSVCPSWKRLKKLITFSRLITFSSVELLSNDPMSLKADTFLSLDLGSWFFACNVIFLWFN